MPRVGLAGSERLCPAAISRRQSRDVRFPGTGASVDSPAESSPMPEIGARRFHHARLSRVLARPGRHARAPTDSTGTPGMPNSGGERTTRTQRKVGEIFGVAGNVRRRVLLRSRVVWVTSYAFRRHSERARGATGSRHHGVAHSVPREQDGGSREATGGLRGAHGGNHGEVRGSVRAAKSVTRPAIGPWGGVRHRTPPSVFPSRATPVAPHAVVADPLASASSRPSPAGRKTGTSPRRRTGTGPRTRCRALCVRADALPRALTRAARRPSAFPRARRDSPRALATPPEHASGALAPAARRASRARATDRELPARRLPRPRRSRDAPSPPLTARNRKNRSTSFRRSRC